MDWLTWGFVAVIILFTIGRRLVEYKLYRSSVYKVLYSNYTEYRMRKKSVEGMSESYVIKDNFGTGRMVYQVLDKRSCNPSSFVTIFLTTGCYIFGISNSEKVNKDWYKLCKEFYKKNIEEKLNDLVYSKKELPVSFFLIVPESYSGDLKNRIIKRSDLVSTMRKEHNGKERLLSEDDIEHIFKIVAKEALIEEDEKKFSTIMTKDK